MSNDKKVINVKLDIEIKSKLETLAYLQGMSLQDLCAKLIQDAISDNEDAIAKAEELRASFKN